MDNEARARSAEALLNNEMLQEAIASLRDGAISAWIGTKADDQKAREIAWYSIKAADRVTEYLKEVVENNRFEANRVARQPLP